MRDRVIRIRVSKAEERQVKDLASARGLSASELIRRTSLGARMPARKFDQSHIVLFAQMLGQLGRVGGNLNQLVRLANAGRLVGHNADLARTLAQINMVRECIREVML